MRRILIIATLLLLPGICLVAQQFPVQVTPQLVAPYSLQVSDYYTPNVSGSKLNLLLLLRDFNKPSLQVRLRMSITGQTVSITTKEDVVFTPLTIESGVPKYIDPSELAPYFNANNLTFSGITQTQYEQIGKLPEGFYTFCFEVVEVGTNQVVSNKGCTIAWLTLNEPPLLNIPRKAEALIPTTPQNVLFQWTPRHTASPTAYNTDYIFSIVEIPDETVAPEAAFASYAPLYIDSTANTTFLYGADKPALVSGKRYAWRVQAKAKNGTQELAMFRNNGYSETFWFTYQNNCPVPAGITATTQGQRVEVTWIGSTEHLEYRVEYREKNNADAEWFMLGNALPRVSITDLKDTTIYEYRVGGACEYGVYTYSPLHEFTTRSATATTVPECGVHPDLTSSDQPLLLQMTPGDIIKAGDFDVVVTKVSGEGSFSGEGYVKVSWLANLKLGVRFNSIGVGTDNKLKIGFIETTYDPTESGIESLDGIISDVAQFLNNVFGSNWNKFSITTYNGTITGAVLNPDGTVTINGSTGSQTIPAGKNYIVSDNNGNAYYISEGGQITQAEGPKGSAIGQTSDPEVRSNTTSISPGMPVIKFSGSAQTKYAFDIADEYVKSGGKQYEQLSTEGTPYFVNWKLLQTGQEEFINATLAIEGTDTDISVDSIRFKRTDGTIIPAPYNAASNTWTIAVKGRLNLYTDALWAVVNQYPGTDSVQEKILGKINLVNVDKFKKHVALVPVNGQGEATDASQIQQSLNEIYKPFAIEWEVTKKPNLTVSGYNVNQALKVERKFLNLAYGNDLNLLIDTYGRIDGDTSVFFMVKSADPSDVEGYMALGNKYGFLFLNGSASANSKSIAHELGHGAFELSHIFGDNDDDQGKTSNLMDYSGADANMLCLEQWRQIHDSKLRIRFGQSVDDGELASLNNMALLESFKQNGYYTFLSPSGKLISLPETITQVTFTTGDVWDQRTCTDKKFDVLPFGTLQGFRWNGDLYSVTKSCTSNIIQGYRKNNTTELYHDTYTFSGVPTRIIIGIPVINNGHLDYAVGTVLATSTVPVSSDNKADGNEQSHDFLIDKFQELYNNPDKVKYAYAVLNPNLRNSKEAMDFLQKNADYAAFGQKYGLYVFAHAYQIAKFPEVYNNPCGVLYDRVRKEDPHEYEYELVDNTNVATINYAEDPEEWLKNTTIRWAAMKLSRYEELKNSLNEVNKLTEITNAADVQAKLAKFRENGCVWKGMNIANRIHALKTLLNSDYVNGSWLGLANNKEYYVVKLLTTVTTQADGFAIADALKENDYALVFRAFDKMDGGNLDAFVNIVTQWIIAQNPVDKDAFFATETSCTSCTNKFFNLFNKIDGGTQKTLFSGALYTGDNTLEFYTNNSFYHSNEWTNSGIIKYAGKPFDLVGITFRENFEYNAPQLKRSITNGSRAAVPLFWAYWFQLRYNKDQALHGLRLSADVIAAIFSGGIGNAALRALEIALAATDFLVTANRTSIIAEYGTEGEEFIDAFDKIGAVGGGMLISKGIITWAAGKYGLTISKIRTVYNELKAGDPQTLIRFRKNLNDLASGMKKLVQSAGETVANLKNMYNKLIDEIGYIYLAGRTEAIVQNLSLAIKDQKYLVVISGGVERQIATGEMVNGAFKITGDVEWMSHTISGTPICRIKNITYTRNGAGQTGDLLLVTYIADGKVVYSFVDNSLGVENLMSAFKAGWSRQRILSNKWGLRQLPTVYLDAGYMERHLARFYEEGGAFLAPKSWVEGSKFETWAAFKYCMLRSDMERVINLYVASGKRAEVLEDCLGFERGALKNEECYVFYVDKSEFDFHFTNGNERGANDLYSPGGYTSGGYRECTMQYKLDQQAELTEIAQRLGMPPIDPGVIIHKKSINYLKTKFEYFEL